MATSWKLPPLGRSPYLEARDLITSLRVERMRPWSSLVKGLPNRRVAE